MAAPLASLDLFMSKSKLLEEMEDPFHVVQKKRAKVKEDYIKAHKRDYEKAKKKAKQAAQRK